MKHLFLFLTSALCLLTSGFAATPADYGSPVTAAGEYSFPATIPAGNRCTYQLTGNFSGAAVTPGYISSAGAFTALGSAVNVAQTLGPYALPLGPATGKATPALSISGGVSPAIRLTVVQVNGGEIPLNAASITAALGYTPADAATAGGGSFSTLTGDPTDNASLQTALDEKVEADLALADVINFQPHATAKAMLDNMPVRIAATGDSLVTLGGIAVGPYMSVIGKFGSGHTLTAGSAPTANPNFADWLFYGSKQFLAGSTVELGCGNSPAIPITGDRFSIYIVKNSSGGTFDVQWQSNGSSAWTTMTSGANGFDGENVSASNATPLGFVITGHLAIGQRPAYKIRITDVTGGGVSVIGAGIYNSRGKGVIWMGDLLAAGGTDFPDPLTCPQAIWEPILRDMSIDLALSCWADPASVWDAGGNFETYVSKFATANAFTVSSCVTGSTLAYVTHPAGYAVKAGMLVSGTGIPTATYVVTVDSPTQFTMSSAATASGTITASFNSPTDWVQISAHPLTSTETGIPALLANQQAWAIRSKQSFINMHTVFRDVQWMVDRGFKSSIDDAHLTTRGGSARWAHMWSRLPIGQMPVGGAMGNYAQDPVFSVNGGTGAGDAVQSSRPLHLKGTAGGIILQDRGSLYGDAAVSTLYMTGGETFVASSIYSYSSIAGMHPSGNNLMLGGRGNLRYRLGATGIQVGYRATTTDATFATDDHTIEVTSGSPTITLPLATATSASTATNQNIAAGIAGKIFVLVNSGAGTVTLATTSSQTINGSAPGTLAAGARIRYQSTGTAWISL